MRWRLATVAAAMVLGAAPSGAIAESLSRADQRLAWESEGAGERDSYAFDVALPSGVWSEPGGVQVGIKWRYSADEVRDFDLAVVGPGGTVVGVSAGLDEDSETVIIPSALNGPYRVEVVAKGAATPFRGWVEVERATAAAPLRDLLPNLVTLPQRRIGFDAGVGRGSCLHEERSDEGAERCLRMEQAIANVGDGPMEIRYGLGPSAGGLQPLLQLIHRSDGSIYERPGDQWEYHEEHAHFHYRNFALSQLWRADEEGRILGAAPLRTGRKNGFCLLDVENIWWDRKGDAAKKHNGCEPAVQGIGVGWADVYNHYLHGQYVEVSGVPDGHYVLETIADPPMPGLPEGSILETDETDNSAFVHLRLKGDHVDVVSARPVTYPIAPAALPPQAAPPGAGPDAPSVTRPPGAVAQRPLPVRLLTRRLRAGRNPRLRLAASRPVRDLRVALVPTRRHGAAALRGRLGKLHGSARVRLRGRAARGEHVLKLSGLVAGQRRQRVVSLRVR